MQILDDAVTTTVLVLSAVIALGLLIGKVEIFKIKFGVAGVLFVGLMIGHLQIPLNQEILNFIRGFGLILFVYMIGLQVGPGFFDSLKSTGLILNLLASLVVFLGVLITLGLYFSFEIQVPALVGIFSGSTTNTPSLGAAQQTLRDLLGQASPLADLPALGYAVAYPFGIIGTLLAMLLVRAIFKIDPRQEAQKFTQQNQRTANCPSLTSYNLILQNSSLAGNKLQDIKCFQELGLVVSRIKHKDTMKVAEPEDTLHLNDILYVVGQKSKIQELQKIIGSFVEVNLIEETSNIDFQEIVLTKRNLIGKTLDDLQLRKLYGVITTRVRRGDQEFLVRNTNLQLFYGDILRVVGSAQALSKVAATLGNSTQELKQPNLLFMFAGIILGVLIGSIPLQIPGLEVPIKLGLAGGPLIVALLASRLPLFGSLVSYFPHTANLAFRELGIAMFLACVGLKSGAGFLNTLLAGDGLLWMACGSLITFIPLLIVGLMAHKVFKINYLTLSGLLAGSMTDPPAMAFAESMAGSSDAPSISYTTVFPLVTVLRIISAQLLILILAAP